MQKLAIWFIIEFRVPSKLANLFPRGKLLEDRKLSRFPKNQMCSSPLFRHLRRGGTITKIIMAKIKDAILEEQETGESFYFATRTFRKVCMDCKLVVTTNNLFCDACEKRGEELFERGRGN